MSTSNYILPKLQFAARDYLKSDPLLIGDISVDSIIAGLAASLRSPALVICQAYAAESKDVPFTGNWEATMIVQVRSDSDRSTEEEHHARAQAIFDRFATSEVFGGHSTPSVLSDYCADFTAFLAVPLNQRFGVDDPHWVSEIELRVTCCGSDIS